MHCFINNFLFVGLYCKRARANDWEQDPAFTVVQMWLTVLVVYFANA